MAQSLYVLTPKGRQARAAWQHLSDPRFVTLIHLIGERIVAEVLLEKIQAIDFAPDLLDTLMEMGLVQLTTSDLAVDNSGASFDSIRLFDDLDFTLKQAYGQENRIPAPDAERRTAPRTLNENACQMLRQLPERIALNYTAQHYPHILNHLASDWRNHTAFVHQIEQLLLSERGNRVGFTLEVALELTELKTWYLQNIAPDIELRREPNRLDRMR